MRILYLTFDDLSIPYAWSVHVREIVNGLVARGHQVRLVCPGGRAPGVKADCDPLPPGKLQHWSGSLSTFVRSGQAFGPDVVYVRGIHGTVTPALAAGRLGRPLVVEVNGLLEDEVKGWRRAIARRSHRFTLQRAAGVVTVSPLLKEALMERYGVPPGRIEVVPNGVDPAVFRPGDREAAREKLGLPKHRPVIVSVGGFFTHHAVDFLIAAAGKTGALLVLVGKEGPSGGDILHAGRVAHDRVPDFIAAADVGAYVLRAPHRQFGYSPLKVFEYMACARPVAAATDLREIQSFINDQGIGVATGLEVDAFARAMGGLVGDPEGARRMGEHGRSLAESRYTWDRAAGRVEQALLRATQS
ncbi:MAG TPA: glycosyltransferase family 4 protein [Planctomycetota bacterium]|nr:glycosyltransferase family 4 protein [Planctomycetota bacterium]